MNFKRLLSRRKKERIRKRNIEILRLRNFENWTLQRIGDRYGITRERVRQIVKKHPDHMIDYRAIDRIRAEIDKRIIPIIKLENRMDQRAKKFWGHVKIAGINDCWEWQASKNPINDYGIFTFSMLGERYAHRVAWILYNGPIPQNMCVLHKCDNPCCVNPKHLFLGTASDNHWDAVNKETKEFDQFHNPKLSKGDKLRIRQDHANGISIKGLSQKYNVTKSYIYKIVGYHS